MSSGIVAEKSSVWRSSGTARTIWSNLRRKTHVEHAVGFIQNQRVNGAQIDGAVLQVVDQTARRGDDDVGIAAQLRPLLANRRAANQNRRF